MSTKPGEKALEAIKKLNSEVSLFKVPKAPQCIKKNKMKILTEEQYIEELGKIIQKDFFPDLEKLKAQNQYLDAMEKNDVVKLRELYAKYSGKKPKQRLGSESPATFETPQHSNTFDGSDTPISTTSSTKGDRFNSAASVTSSFTKSNAPSHGHSLDSFLSTYTSEDNNSFQELIESADKRLRQKFSVLYEAEKNTALEIANSLELPSIEDQFDVVEGPKKVDTWTYTNKNYIMYVPDGVDLMKEEKLEMAKQKQEIDYSNTRLKHSPFDEQHNKDTINELAKVQAKGLTGRIGIDGNALMTLAGTPNIRGFSFVKTPSPQPGITDSPMMTWGELEGTPFRLDGSDTPYRPSIGPSFRIAETSRRETIALSLAEKAGERMRDHKAKAIETARRNIASPHIRSSLERLATMSPAAKRLASSRIGVRDLTPSPRSFKSGHKSHQTPSPLVRKRTPVIIGSHFQSKTPTNRNTKTTVLTDDLLNIPSKSKDRPKAADYF